MRELRHAGLLLADEAFAAESVVLPGSRAARQRGSKTVRQQGSTAARQQGSEAARQRGSKAVMQVTKEGA